MKEKSATVLFAILTVMAFTILSCKKDEPYMSNAKIIGFDLKLCPCCGGHEVTIDNFSNPNGYPYFLAEQLPAGFNLGDNPKFPIAVKIDWKTNTAQCFGNYIVITRIARR